MKRPFFTVAFLLLCCSSLLFAQSTVAQKWFSLSDDYKIGLVNGIMVGLRHGIDEWTVKELKSGTTNPNWNLNESYFLFNKIGEQSYAFWISIIDTFYYEKENANVPLLDGIYIALRRFVLSHIEKK